MYGQYGGGGMMQPMGGMQQPMPGPMFPYGYNPQLAQFD
jgi:hypothetical protein